jgi:hypothetical protein
VYSGPTGYSSAKIGITDAMGSRLKKHRQRGWQVLTTVGVPGELALAIEKEILDWWRAELALPIHLGKRKCPTAAGPRQSTQQRSTSPPRLSESKTWVTRARDKAGLWCLG